MRPDAGALRFPDGAVARLMKAVRPADRVLPTGSRTTNGSTPRRGRASSSRCIEHPQLRSSPRHGPVAYFEYVGERLRRRHGGRRRDDGAGGRRAMQVPLGLTQSVVDDDRGGLPHGLRRQTLDAGRRRAPDAALLGSRMPVPAQSTHALVEWLDGRGADVARSAARRHRSTGWPGSVSGSAGFASTDAFTAQVATLPHSDRPASDPGILADVRRARLSSTRCVGSPEVTR